MNGFIFRPCKLSPATAFPFALILVPVLAIAACGGDSTAPAADDDLRYEPPALAEESNAVVYLTRISHSPPGCSGTGRS